MVAPAGGRRPFPAIGLPTSVQGGYVDACYASLVFAVAP